MDEQVYKKLFRDSNTEEKNYKTTSDTESTLKYSVDEIDLDGALTTRATLHNLSIIKQLELGIGDVITVYRSNMVIPKIDDNLTRSNTLEIPKKCPCCGSETVIKDTDNSQVLMCMNSDCAAKKIKSFTHL